MRAGFNKWWLLPVGVLVSSAMVALNIVIFGSFFIDRPTAEVAQPVNEAAGASKAAGCSGALATDYACHQDRYQALVRDSGVGAAFTELKADYEENEFVKSQCHQMTHVIGRAAAEVYGDIPGTYGNGDTFCWSGYYHGAMEAVVAKIGPEKILAEAPEICAELEDHQRYSFYHYNCVHGLGHGFMGIQENELFESLETCDTLEDGWERESCYGGAFMENIIAKNNPSHPSKHLKADEPLYPCTAVETRYKTQCYLMQTSYALETQGYNFVKVFELCGTVEGEFRPICYQSLGRDASGQSTSDVVRTKATCNLGEGYEARSNCVIGAVKDFISYYDSDVQARALCESFRNADLRSTCFQTSEEYYATFEKT